MLEEQSVVIIANERMSHCVPVKNVLMNEIQSIEKEKKNESQQKIEREKKENVKNNKIIETVPNLLCV